MQPRNPSTGSSIGSSPWVGATVIANNGQVEGEINEAVIDSVTGEVRYFIVEIDNPPLGRPSIFALPVGDCSFDEAGKSCIAKSLYPLRV